VATENILVKLAMNAGDYVRGASKATKATNDITGAANVQRGSLRTLATTYGGVAKAAAGVFVAKQAVDFGRASVRAFSDLEESLNAVEVGFGGGADAIKDFGTTAAEQIGLSNAQFNQLSVTTGALMSNFIDDQRAAADETIKLTQRAADMASVFNTTVPDALQAVQAALRGEQEPIRRFGVLIDEAAVKSKALELGLADTASALTTQDKALVRLQLIYEQTNKTAGDFANTSDSLANQQRILAAKFEDTKAKVGESLAPAMESLLDTAQDFLPVLEKIVPALGNAAVGFIGLGSAIAQAAAGPLDLLGIGLNVIAANLGSDASRNLAELERATRNLNTRLEEGEPDAVAYANTISDLARTGGLTGKALDALAAGLDFKTPQQQAKALSLNLESVRAALLAANATPLRGIAVADDELKATQKDLADSVMVLEQALLDQINALDLTVSAKQALVDAEGIAAVVTRDNIQLVSELTDGYEETAVRQHDAAAAAEAASEAKSKAYIDEANEVDALREAERNEALAAAKRRRDFPGQIVAIDKAAAAFKGLAGNIRGATSAALEAASPALALNAANERVAAAEDALKTVREDGKSSAEDMASAVADLTGAQLELDAQRANVLGTMGDTETAMRNAATEVGITKEEFDTFWQSLDDRPSSVDFDINFRGHVSGFGNLGLPPAPTLSSGGITETRHQHGGDFKTGEPIMVGEAGPELLIPTGAGSIVPNNQLSQNVTVHMEGTGDVYDDMTLALAMSGITEEIEWSGTNTLRG
jgi:hypothetical protein